MDEAISPENVSQERRAASTVADCAKAGDIYVKGLRNIRLFCVPAQQVTRSLRNYTGQGDSEEFLQSCQWNCGDRTMLSAAYETPTPFTDCKRCESRTNMFVMAKLVSSGTSCMVKVRNMSPHGALVEGASLPVAGTPCVLVREDMSLEGRIIWLGTGKAGIQFHGVAQIGEWLPSARKAQQEVDRAVAMAKAEFTGTTRSEAPAILPSTAISADDVLRAANALELLANDLADEPAVIARFMTRLQTLDISIQALRKLAELIPNPPR